MHFFCIFLRKNLQKAICSSYLCGRNRVRQLVAMVHTTPLNGQAPNASALRSDYHSVSSPPEGERVSKVSKDFRD